MLLVVDLKLVELIDPMLCNAKILHGRMWRVIAELCVRHHRFNLRAINEVVVGFDGDELGAANQSCLKADLKVLSIASESTQAAVVFAGIVIARPDSWNENEIIHFRELLQLLPVLPC